MGYGDEFSLTAKSHDGGIDGIVNEDVLGLDKIYLQAKRYADNKVNGKDSAPCRAANKTNFLFPFVYTVR